MQESLSPALPYLNAVGSNEARALYYELAPTEPFMTIELNRRLSALLPRASEHQFQADRFDKYVDRYYAPAGLINYEHSDPQHYVFSKPDNLQAAATVGAALRLSSEMPQSIKWFWGRGVYLVGQSASELATSDFAYRVELIAALALAGASTYSQLQDTLDVPAARVYNQVSKLKSAGIVDVTKSMTIFEEPLYVLNSLEPTRSKGPHAIVAHIMSEQPQGLTRGELRAGLLTHYSASHLKRIFSHVVPDLLESGELSVSGEFRWEAGKSVSISPDYAEPISTAIDSLYAIARNDTVACTGLAEMSKQLLARPKIVDELLSKCAQTG
jgi:hypothetical protein